MSILYDRIDDIEESTGRVGAAGGEGIVRVSQVFQTCKHDSTSLVEMYSKNGAFLTTQCDLCGMCLPAILIDATTFDAWLDGRLLVPHVDNPAYDAAIGRALHDVMNGDVAGLEVFVKVVRGKN